MNQINNGKPYWYSEYSEKEGLSAEDQKWIWDNVPHTENKDCENDNVFVNRRVNDTHKNEVKTELTSSKHRVISELKECSYRTPPKKVASLLKELFNDPDTMGNYWLYVAQHWAPRPINQVITQMIKRHKRGDSTIKKPAAYFSSLIRYRKKRKCFRSTDNK